MKQRLFIKDNKKPVCHCARKERSAAISTGKFEPRSMTGDRSAIKASKFAMRVMHLAFQKPFVLWILLLATFISGCDPYKQDDYKKEYVVEAYLIADANLPQVKISKTLPIDEVYSFSNAALENATVAIERLNVDGSPDKTYTYHPTSPGVYQPDNPEHVLPERSYVLHVSFPNGDSMRAKTLVPGAFHTVGTIPDSAVYQSPQRIAVNVTPSAYPGRQSYFIFTVNVVNPSKSRLTPFYADALDRNDEGDITNFYINSSGIVNEKNYEENPDSTITIKLPWIAVAFYGQNKIVANTIDDNMYDFLRSQSVQTGGSTLPPGQIQNIIYHVDGGIGIFGSMASDTISVFIKRDK